VIRNIVDNAFTENRNSQMRIGFLSADLSELSIEDEIVPLGSQRGGQFPSQHDEGEDIAILTQCGKRSAFSHAFPIEFAGKEVTNLLLTIKEELVRIHPVHHGAAEERQVVEHHGRFRRILEEQLLQNIDHYRKYHEGNNSNGVECRRAQLQQFHPVGLDRNKKRRQYTHGEKRELG
jgi:hypothetical protein